MKAIKRELSGNDIIHENVLLDSIIPNPGRCHFVVDDNGRYVGILSLKDYETGIALKNITAGSACNRNAKVIFAGASSYEEKQKALELLASTSFFYIPVITSDHKPLCFYIRCEIQNFIIKASSAIEADSTIFEALFKFQKSNTLYVMKGSQLVGVLSRSDMQKAFDSYDNVHELSILDICNKEYLFTTFETIQDDFDKILKRNDIPVIDNNKNLLYVLNRAALKNLQSWTRAQDFEMDYWVKDLRMRLELGDNLSAWYSQIKLKDQKIRDRLANCWQGKACMEIGAGPLCGYIAKMADAKRRIIIEPLADKYKELRKDLYIEIPNVENIDFYSKPADYYIPELKDSIDGWIICENALDHTPNWCFVLSNIALYAKKGTYLYLWTDILHTTADPAGHFNITPDPGQFFRLVESLGFELIHTEVNDSLERANLYVSIAAIKR